MAAGALINAAPLALALHPRMEHNPGVNSIPRMIYEDGFLLVIDKPAGMPSVSLKAGEENTLAAWVLARFPDQVNIGDGMREAGLVHRLDNDTSGLVVAARSPDAFEALKAQFREGTATKEYTALVLGNPPNSGEIEAPIAHHPRKKKKMVVCVSMREAEELKARPAHTEYRTAERFALQREGARARYALLHLKISTGLRHQIRLHLASIGHPIAGDALYQNPRMRAADKLSLSRHFLHASKIAFLHPEDGRRVEFESPLPEDLAEAISLFQL